MRQSKEFRWLSRRMATSLVILTTMLSMVVTDFALARQSRNFGGSRGGASVQQRYSGGAARSNASRRSQSSQRSLSGFSGGVQNKKWSRQRQGRRGQYQAGRRDQRAGRQTQWGQNQGNRQEGRTDRTRERQQDRSDRVDQRTDTRRDIADDIADNSYWRNHSYYHGGYCHGNDAAWAFFAGLTLGAVIASLPPRHETVFVLGATYYYANGTYYQVAPGGSYVVVAAPQGATVQHAPTQVTNVYVNDKEYG